jgi:4-hydroxybenzoate polyprenyltransferase
VAIRAYVGLFHLIPIALVLLASGIFMGLAYRGFPQIERLVPFLAAMLLTQIAISFHNHYWDRDLDARTKPWRALPAGIVAPGVLHGLAWALFAVGVLIAGTLEMAVAGLVAFGTLSAFAYNRWLKDSIWSWVPFWLAMPTLPVAAFAAAQAFRPVLLQGYLIGIPIVLAVHLSDSLPDIADDRASGVLGLPHMLGLRWANIAAWGLLALGLALIAITRPQPSLFDPWPFASVGLLGLSILLSIGAKLRCGSASNGSKVTLPWQRPILLGCAGTLAVSWLAAL